MVLLAGLSKKCETVGDDHQDQHCPGQDGSDDRALQEVHAEEGSQTVEHHPFAKIVEPFGGFLHSLDEAHHLEEVVRLN